MGVKIAIIKTSALGDIVHLFPTVQFIKEIFRDAEIDWIVEEGGKTLVERHPLVTSAFVINTKKWRKHFFSKEVLSEITAFIKNVKSKKYDYVFDFQGNVKSGLIMSLIHGDKKIGFGFKTAPEKPNVLFSNIRFNPPPYKNIREDYLYLVEECFQRKGDSLFKTTLKITKEEERLIDDLMADSLNFNNILVAPFSIWKNKELDDESLIQQLYSLENDNVKFWFIYGGEIEKKRALILSQKVKRGVVLEKLSLPLLQNFMKRMNLVLAMDSLPLHLAGEAGVSTHSFFGASLAKKYAPIGKIHLSVQGKCPYNIFFEKRCPRLRSCATGACIRRSDTCKLS